MRIVAISGSLRDGSSNGAMLRAIAGIAPDGVEVIVYEGIGDLPHFNPDLDREGDEPPRPVAELRSLLASADGVLISSPEYAHGVPGSLKNALDWLVSAGELVGKPVALINAAPIGGDYAQASLVETLSVMNWNVLRDASLLAPFVKRKGRFDDPETQEKLRAVLAVLSSAMLPSSSAR